MLQCNETLNTNTTVLYSESLEPYVPKGTPKRESIRLRQSYSTYQLYSKSSGLVLEDMSNIPNFLSIAPCPKATNESYQDDKTGSKSFTRFQIANGSVLLGSKAVRRCFAAVARYNVDISFINGIQNISYWTSETQPLKVKTRQLEDMEFRPMNSMQEYVNLLALIDSLVTNFYLDGRALSEINFDLAALESPKWINLTNYDGLVYRRYLSCAAKPVTTLPITGA
jgi:hypothetical protein